MAKVRAELGDTLRREAPVKRIEDLLIEVEKINGKLEILENFRPQVNDRISMLSEEIGDLRRMILDREQASKEMEVEFEKVKDAVEIIEPRKIERRFGKIEENTERLDARSEKLEHLFKEASKELLNVRQVFAKIKSFENLEKEIGKIGEKVREINEAKGYVDRIGGKVESIFSDLNEKLRVLMASIEKIDKIDDLTKEMVKEIDRLGIRFEKDVLKQEDMEKFKGEIKSRVESLEPKKIEKIDSKLKEVMNSLRILEKERIELERKNLESVEKIDKVESELLGKLSEIEHRTMGEIKNYEGRMEKTLKEYEKIVKEKEEIMQKVSSDIIDRLEKRAEEIRMEIKPLAELEREKEIVNKILNKAMQDYRSKKISENTYNEILEKNKNRLREIEDILDRASKEMLYKDIKAVERENFRLRKEISRKASIEKLDEIKKDIRKIHEKLYDFGEIERAYVPMKDSLKIVEDRIRSIEELYREINEKIADLSTVKIEIEDLRAQNKKAADHFEKQREKEREIEGKLLELGNRMENVMIRSSENRMAMAEFREKFERVEEAVHGLEERLENMEREIEVVMGKKADIIEIDKLRENVEQNLKRNAQVIETLVNKLSI